jgi:hypothetical protein
VLDRPERETHPGRAVAFGIAPSLVEPLSVTIGGERVGEREMRVARASLGEQAQRLEIVGTGLAVSSCGPMSSQAISTLPRTCR